MGKEPGFRQRLFGEFVLAALVVILGAWALTRPGLSPRLWTMVLVVVVIALARGLLVLADCIRDRAPEKRR